MLGLESVGIHDDFFSLGGDSIVSIRMVSRARQAGLDLHVNTLLMNPTIESLGRALEGPSGPAGEERCLVAIHTDGDRVPLVGIHAGPLTALEFRKLWEHLGTDQPMYAMQPVGLDGVTEPLDSVAAMAARYVDELREVQPAGPYRLVGNCFGGIVALEMAGMLEAAGEQVELVTVVDGATPLHPARPQPVVARAAAVYRKRGAMGLLRKVRARVTTRLRPPPAGTPGEDPQPVDAVSAVRQGIAHAFATYEPKPVAAPVLLIRSSRHQLLGEGYDWGTQWGEYTPSFTEVTVDGQKEDMFSTPNVESLAAILKAHIGASDED
jgi:thioesterase domain-containing protein/aryl carrier-like protein